MRTLTIKIAHGVGIILVTFGLGVFIGVLLHSQDETTRELERNHEIRRSFEKSWKKSRAEVETDITASSAKTEFSVESASSTTKATQTDNIEYRIYRNEEWGFEFEYPTNFEPQEGRFEALNVVFNLGLVENGRSFDEALLIVVPNDLFAHDIDDMVASGLLQNTTIGGRPALFGILENKKYSMSGLETEYYFIDLNDKFQLQISGRIRSESLYKSIVDSFTFFTPSPQPRDAEEITTMEKQTDEETWLFGLIESINKDEGVYYLLFDTAMHLTGAAARESYIRRGTCPEIFRLNCIVPNAYTIENDSKVSVRLPVVPEAKVVFGLAYFCDMGPDMPSCEFTIEEYYDRFYGALKKDNEYVYSLFNIRVEDGQVVEIENQYVP